MFDPVRVRIPIPCVSRAARALFVYSGMSVYEGAVSERQGMRVIKRGIDES